MVPVAGGAADDELRHSGGCVVVRMHFCRIIPAEAALLWPIRGRSALQNLRVRSMLCSARLFPVPPFPACRHPRRFSHFLPQPLIFHFGRSGLIFPPNRPECVDKSSKTCPLFSGFQSDRNAVYRRMARNVFVALEHVRQPVWNIAVFAGS